MLINYHVTGAERKRLVKTIASYTGCDAKYLGVPSCAYRVDCFTIDREGAEHDPCRVPRLQGVECILF